MFLAECDYTARVKMTRLRSRQSDIVLRTAFEFSCGRCTSARPPQTLAGKDFTHAVSAMSLATSKVLVLHELPEGGHGERGIEARRASERGAMSREPRALSRRPSCIPYSCRTFFCQPSFCHCPSSFLRYLPSGFRLLSSSLMHTAACWTDFFLLIFMHRAISLFSGPFRLFSARSRTQDEPRTNPERTQDEPRTNPG